VFREDVKILENKGIGKFNKNKVLVGLTLVLLVVLLFSSLDFKFIVSAQLGGYSTAFEGPKATFYGIKYQLPNGQTMTLSQNQQNSVASLQKFDTVLSFDGDAANSGKPNLYGEMTSIFIPQNSVSDLKPWVPFNLFGDQNNLVNPVGEPYQWNISGNAYYMQQWRLRWYVGISAEWDGGITDIPVVGGGWGEAPPQPVYTDGDNSYSNLELWFKLDTTPTWYYQGAQKTYFAIAKTELAKPVDYAGTTNSKGGLFSTNLVEPRSTVSITPESYSTFYIYDQPFGGDGYTQKEAYTYQGQALNPQYFKDESYIRVLFNKFGVYGGANWLGPSGFWCKGDVVTLCFEVTVFSIGQWTVQDIEKDPSQYGRFVRTEASTNWLDWFLAPSTLAWLIPVAIFAVVLIFVPWVIFALIAVIRAIIGH
jgi:hypothetical protein